MSRMRLVIGTRSFNGYLARRAVRRGDIGQRLGIATVCALVLAGAIWMVLAEDPGRELVEGDRDVSSVDVHEESVAEGVVIPGAIETAPFVAEEAPSALRSRRVLLAEELVITSPDELQLIRDPYRVRVQVRGEDGERWMEEGRLLLAVRPAAELHAVTRHHRSRVNAAIVLIDRARNRGEVVDEKLAADLQATFARIEEDWPDVQKPRVVDERFGLERQVTIREGVAEIALVPGAELLLTGIEENGESWALDEPISAVTPGHPDEEIVFEVQEPRTFVLHVVAAESGEHLRDVTVALREERHDAFQGITNEPLAVADRVLAVGASPITLRGVHLAETNARGGAGWRREEGGDWTLADGQQWVVRAPDRETREISVSKRFGRLVVALSRTARLRILLPEGLAPFARLRIEDPHALRARGAALVEKAVQERSMQFERLPARTLKVVIDDSRQADLTFGGGWGGLQTPGGGPRMEPIEAEVRLVPGRETLLDLTDRGPGEDLDPGSIEGVILVPVTHSEVAKVSSGGLALRLRPEAASGEADRVGGSVRSRGVRAFGTEVRIDGRVWMRQEISSTEVPPGRWVLHCSRTGWSKRIAITSGEATTLDERISDLVPVRLVFARSDGRRVHGAATLESLSGGATHGGRIELSRHIQNLSDSLLSAPASTQGIASGFVLPDRYRVTWKAGASEGMLTLVVKGPETSARIVVEPAARVHASITIDGEPGAWPPGWRIVATPQGGLDAPTRTWAGGGQHLLPGRWSFQVIGSEPWAFPLRHLTLRAGGDHDLTFRL